MSSTMPVSEIGGGLPRPRVADVLEQVFPRLGQPVGRATQPGRLRRTCTADLLLDRAQDDLLGLEGLPGVDQRF